METEHEKAMRIAREVREVYAYSFARQIYNLNMAEAARRADLILSSDPRKRYGKYRDQIVSIFTCLNQAGIRDCRELAAEADTPEHLAILSKRTAVSEGDIVAALWFWRNWVLPGKKYLRELVEKDDSIMLKNLTVLREHGIKFNLDLLERGRTKENRQSIARETGLPEEVITELTHRSDFTRLPFFSRAAIQNHFGAGYCTLEKLAAADLETLVDDMVRYAISQGKKPFHGMEYDTSLAMAKIQPKIIES